jgi:hypothetical protein
MLRQSLPALCLPLFLSAALATAQVAPALKKPLVAAPTTKPAPAQNAEERVAALTNNMVQALGLTPAQAEKVRVINANGVRNVEAARQRYKDNPAKLRGYVEDIGLARLDQLKEVLTANQFTRYQQKREEKMGIPTVRSYQGTPPPGLGSNGRGGDE